MRGSLVVLAVALSLASVAEAQTRPMCEKDPGNPSAAGEANRTKKCPPPPPPPVTGTVTISGTVFFDLPPYDGIYDPSNEQGIAGWDVILTGPTGQLTYNTATDPNNPGAFVFSGLPTGATYTLCVVPSIGWTQTAPTSTTTNVITCTTNGITTAGYSISVPPLAGDATVQGQDFGFYSNP